MKNYLYILVIAFAAGCAASENKEEENTLPKLPVLQVNTIDTVLKHDYVTSIQAVKNVDTQIQGFLQNICG